MAEGGEEFTISEGERKLIEVTRRLKIKPKVESPEEFEEFMKEYLEHNISPPLRRATFSTTATETKVTHVKISTFSGESGKGETNFKTWEYEIRCLMGKYSDETILNAIRRSVKGEAGKILCRLGVDVGIGDILQKFNSTYGDIETTESLLKKLYACQQERGESVITYAARIEDLYSQGIEIGAVSGHSEGQLKGVFYQGLLPQLKQITNYKFDTIRDYDRFKIEVRKAENELELGKTREKDIKCKAAQKVEDKSELSEVKELLLKMNARIETLEKQKEESQHRQQQRGNYRDGRGRGRGRGQYRGRGQSRGRGQGNYTPDRPTATSTFRPSNYGKESDQKYDHSTRTCYSCGKEGHIARNCQENW